MFDQDVLKQKHEQAADLYASANDVAFGNDGAVMAAEAAAAGSCMQIEEALSDRDKEMLAVGVLAGASAAVARSRFPFEHQQDALERTDIVMEHARTVGARDREQRPLVLPKKRDGGAS